MLFDVYWMQNSPYPNWNIYDSITFHQTHFSVTLFFTKSSSCEGNSRDSLNEENKIRKLNLKQLFVIKSILTAVTSLNHGTTSSATSRMYGESLYSWVLGPLKAILKVRRYYLTLYTIFNSILVTVIIKTCYLTASEIKVYFVDSSVNYLMGKRD